MRTSRYSAPILLSLWLGGCIISSELEGKLEAPPGNPADAGVGQGGSTTTTPDGSDRQSGTASGGGETNATGGSGGNGPTGSPSDSCEPTAGLMQLSSSTSSLSINTASERPSSSIEADKSAAPSTSLTRTTNAGLNCWGETFIAILGSGV